MIKVEFAKPWLNRIVAKLGRHVPHPVILKANSAGGAVMVPNPIGGR